MSTTIEVSASAIRLCVHDDQRITALESWPVPAGADPVAALAAAPLPDGLGRVRVLLHHDDLLTRTLIQPPCPPDRLDRLVRFELDSLAAPGSEDVPPSAVAWHLVPVSSGDGDIRILAQVTRLRLVDRVRQALAVRGAKLAALGHPVLGLYHNFKAQVPDHQGVACLLDVGGSHVHVVLVKDGNLVFLRTHSPGMDELVRQVAAKRGLAEADAASLVKKIGAGSPDDLKDLIAAQAGSVSSAITANVRFARSQLKLTEFEPTHIYLAGAGALAHRFAASLGERSKLTVRLLNPFAGQLARIPTELADRLSGIPSAWSAVVGGAGAAAWELDALADERRARRQYWRTEGVLKAAAVAAVLLTGLGIVSLETTASAAATRLAELRTVVPQVQGKAKQAVEVNQQQGVDANRLLWLDGERRPGRVVNELLTGIGKLQDPANCPVVLSSFALSRQGGGLVVDISGYAISAKVGADVAVRAFVEGLRREYPAISAIKELPTTIEKDRLAFKYQIAIPDA
jgi:hypothetical protein